MEGTVTISLKEYEALNKIKNSDRDNLIQELKTSNMTITDMQIEFDYKVGEAIERAKSVLNREHEERVERTVRMREALLKKRIKHLEQFTPKWWNIFKYKKYKSVFSKPDKS